MLSSTFSGLVTGRFAEECPPPFGRITYHIENHLSTRGYCDMAHELTQDWISNYDDILSTDSQFDTEEDENDYDPKDFSGVTDNDRELLQQEEEREKLLTSGIQHEDRSGSHDVRGSRRNVHRPRKRRPTEKVDLMYQMEEGGFKDDRSPQASSSSLELETIQAKPRSVSDVGLAF